MAAKFVIVSAPRTGSTLLVKTLNQVEGICCHGELLLPKHVRGLEDGFDTYSASPEQRQARASDLLEDRNSDPVGFVSRALESAESAVGLKVIYEDLLKPRWRDVLAWLLQQSDMHFIHLVRENTLRRYISEQVMLAGGAIHSDMGGGSTRKAQVKIDPAAFELRCKQIEAEAAAVISALGAKPLQRIRYEDLASRLPETINEICQFLDVSSGGNDMKPALQKVGQHELEGVVLNYQDILQHPVTRPFLQMD